MPHLSGNGLGDLLGVVSPFVHHLPWRLSRHHCHPRRARGYATLLRQRYPGTVLFILRQAKGELPRMPECCAIDLAGNAPEHVDQPQADGTANRGISTITVAEHAVRGVHPKSGPNGAVDDDQWRAPAGAGGAGMPVV